jgi:hypothetical protein
LQFEVPKAQPSIAGIKRRVSPIDPKRALQCILSTIEPLIVLQERVHRIAGEIRKAGYLPAHQAIALHIRIGAEWSPIRQGLATDSKTFATATGTAFLDRGTKTHAQQIAQLAEAVARKLKRPEEEIHLVYQVVLLRDVGKRGPLTEEEWSIVRHHPAIGCHILALLISSVLAQHERWDGRGYPHRLTQEEIPLSARILAVVDSYDVMTTPRPYRRDPLSLGKAKTELQRGAGSRYDPQVVEAFLSVLAEQENQAVPLGASEVPSTSDAPTSTIRVSTDHLWQQPQQRLAWQKQKLEQQTLFTVARSEQSCYFKRSIVPMIPQSGKNTSKNKPTAFNTLA